MTQNLQTHSPNHSAFRRFVVLAALICFLTAQIFAGWHTAQHAAHANAHCNVCASVAQLDHAVPVVVAKAQMPALFTVFLYNTTAQTHMLVAVALAYEAQGPPSV